VNGRGIFMREKKRGLKKLHERNLDYINSGFLSFKDKNIPKYIKRLQESIEKKLLLPRSSRNM
jgi:hypothetical protein